VGRSAHSAGADGLSALKPDRHDAALLIMLAQWSMLLGLPISQVPTASHPSDEECLLHFGAGSYEAHAVCDYLDTVGLLYAHGLLNEDLLFEWLSVSFIWDETKDYVAEQRRERHRPNLWAHFEALAVAHKRLNREYAT
jgi:hypothetical protein